MSPLIIGLVAISAVLHVAWNVRLKTAGDALRAATIGMLAAGVVIVPGGLAAWWIGGAHPLPVDGLALGVGSGIVEAAYFIFLAAAYRRGDLSVVYPLARGTAPLLAVAIGVGALGERLGVAGSLGVIGLLLGFLWLQRPWRALALARRGARGGAARRSVLDSPVLFALLTGVTIATYTTIDRLGTRLIDPVPYAAILWATCSVVLVAWVAVVAGGDLFRDGGDGARRAAVGGWLTLGAYLCILGALSVAPLSGVAPLRESATVFAAAWGSVRMGEAADRAEVGRRVGASVLIVGGALLLAFGG
ncbi:MAG TPA: EamA family transporter [Candidatus Limnocylindrales bacterium]